MTCGNQADIDIEQLAASARVGCRESFEQIVLHFEKRIFHFLLHMSRNRHDAEDLTQITFLKAYRDLQSYASGRSFGAWLFTIAKRTALNHLRSARRTEELTGDFVSQAEMPSTALERSDGQKNIWELARTLKPHAYEVLWLRYGEGFSVAETARVMNTNQIRVRVLLHRARAALAKKLERRKE
ncbi:MAG: sigma-70 family RNA polymerase sigma factor [Verrucomicrobia bacterium]|nr:sigma-70 family RNA polymerase sigma factor [Verrucomicrobiota bacterium]